MSMRPIYFDYSATTPVDPRVVDKMIPWLYENAGNPASRSHAYGWEAEEAVERARAQVASLSTRTRARSFGRQVRPSRTTSRSKAQRASMPSVASTLSPSRLSIKLSLIPVVSLSAMGLK